MIARRAFLLTGVLAVVGLPSLVSASSVARAGGAGPINVVARVSGVARRVPDSMLGFSVEWPELPIYEADLPAFARLLALLSVSGEPVPLRIGGESADSTYLRMPGQFVPANAYILNDGYFTALARLARAARVALMVDLNLAARSPRMAQAVGRELSRTVPASSVGGFSVGDEPDLYGLGLLGDGYVKRGGHSPFQWVFHYGPAQYAADFARYARALDGIWPGVRYAGPEVISDRTDFAKLALGTGALSMLTLHRYEFNACPGPGNPKYPTEQRYLSAAGVRAFAGQMRPLVAIARRGSVPLRLTEFGSSICGERGLTDTFATTLWGVNAIFDMLAQGVDGVNVHLHLENLSSALGASAAGSLIVNPLYYSMLLVTRTLGPRATLMRVTTTRAPANLTVWAVQDGHHTTRVLLVNTSDSDVATSVQLGVAGQGTVQRLTAPSASATAGLQFAGRSVSPAGKWTGTPQVEYVRGVGGSFSVSVPRYSAALLAVAR